MYLEWLFETITVYKGLLSLFLVTWNHIFVGNTCNHIVTPVLPPEHPTKQQLYGNLPPITKTIKIRWTKHVGHCWRSRDNLISDVLLWTPSHGRAKAGRPAQTYIQQFCIDTGCSPEDQPEVMDDREGWQERVRDIRADGVTWWWW